MLPSSIAKINIDIRSFKMSRYYLKILDFPVRINYMLIRTLKKKMDFFSIPHVKDINLFEVDLLDFQSILSRPLEFSIFFKIDISGNLRFFLKFWDSPWKFNDFYSTSWNFELISSTRGGRLRIFVVANVETICFRENHFRHKLR